MNPLRNIVIVGGGTAGWLAACYLQRILAADPAAGVRITLIESRQIGTIGVGEATVPTLRGTLATLGLAEPDLFAEADASLKNGIRFVGWRRGGGADSDRYDHPFEAPQPQAGWSTALHWLNLKQHGATTAAMADVAVVQTALFDGLQSPKLMQSPDFQAPLSYAYHLDAVKFAGWLQRVATARGVQHVIGEVVAVQPGPQGIDHLVLGDGSRHRADLFVDCSGFASILLGQALGVPWLPYGDTLACDRAVAMPLAYDDERAPMRSHTTATAQASGWTWEIDLSTRTGLGHVYSSAHCSDDEAVATLRRQAGGRRALAEPRLLRMKVGHHARSWEGNCLALGLAGGFIEPLESTAIYLIEYALQLFIDHLPGHAGAQAGRDRFNMLLSDTYDELRDFVLLHYVISQRRDTPFWRHVTEGIDLPPSLAEALALWDVKFPSPTDMLRRLSLFGAHNWFYILAGMHRLPSRGAAQAAYIPMASSVAALEQVRSIRQQARQFSPTMRDYVQKVRSAVANRPAPLPAVEPA